MSRKSYRFLGPRALEGEANVQSRFNLSQRRQDDEAWDDSDETSWHLTLRLRHMSQA